MDLIKKIIGLIGTAVVAVIFFFAYLYQQETGETVEGDWANFPAPAPDSRFEYDIFFTNGSCPPETERFGGVDEEIALDIVSAFDSVEIASFDLDSEPIINALIEAESRGVQVSVVVDNEHTPESTINRLRRNGMSVIEDNRSALMHNKFIIIDSQVLWMGSMNFTSNGVYCNNNNVVRFQSQSLSRNYQLEFNEMYYDREFGPTSTYNTEDRLYLGGVEVENRFSAEEDVAPIIARLIYRANRDIRFMTFSFTNEDIGEAIIERASDGLDVKGVFESRGSEQSFSYYPDFVREGLDNLQVRQDGNGHSMHHKVLIIDEEITVLGSFNFSNQANDSNDENTLIIHDAQFTSYFLDEFDLVWDEASE